MILWLLLFGVIGVGAFWLDHRKLMRKRANARPLTVNSTSQPPPAEPRSRVRSLASIASDARSQDFSIFDLEPVAQAGEVSPQATNPSTSDGAILFHQHCPPLSDARSYWGGVPLVPSTFRWPSFTTTEGVERALHFIMQIDCAAVPAAQQLGLPDRGLLYVFMDLDWGRFWEHRVVHIDGDARLFKPAAVPASLPRAYGDRGVWPWVERDEDWPRLLPRWSFDPIFIEGRNCTRPVDEDEAHERRFWPGTIDLANTLPSIEGAVVQATSHSIRLDDQRKLLRPFANYPHDWNAVRIAVAAIAAETRRGHIDRYVARGDMTGAEAEAFRIALDDTLEQWRTRAWTVPLGTPLSCEDSNAVWQVFQDFYQVARFALRAAATDAVDASLSGAASATSTLPEDALTLVRASHALASRGDNGLHINTPDHLLGPPSYVQGAAEERLDEWRLLLELSSCSPIGHHFGEGVYQFWIRPGDLAAQRFDRVELEGSAY